MDFGRLAIEPARRNVADGGRPFACVLGRDGEVVAESPNLVAQTNDPTAHAEIVAIREACRQLGTEHLTDCVYGLREGCRAGKRQRTAIRSSSARASPGCTARSGWRTPATR